MQKKSDQNVEKNQSYETFYLDLNFVKDLIHLLITNRNELFILKLLIDMATLPEKKIANTRVSCKTKIT